MNVTIGGIARTVEITSFDKLGDVKVCMLTTTADGSVGFQQLNQEVIDTIYASFPVDTSSGEIASFEDGADNVPVRELKLNLEPYQNLNGYDSPWVGGAGKNLLPITISSQTYHGITLTVNADGSIKVNGTASELTIFILTSSLALPDGTYVINGCPSGGGSSTYRLDVNDGSIGQDTGGSATFNVSGGTGISNVRLRIASGCTVSNLVFLPMIRIAGTSNKFEPYENICPIYPSNGKNLLENVVTDDVKTISGITYTRLSDGSVIANGTATAVSFYSPDNPTGSASPVTDHNMFLDAYMGQKLIVTGTPSDVGSANIRIMIGRQAGSSLANDIGSGATFTVSETGLWVGIRIENGTTVNNAHFYPMIRPVEITDSTYVPYNAIGITRTGRNLLDISNAVNATNVVSGVSADGTIAFKDVNAQWSNRYIGKMHVISGVQYTMSGTIAYGRIGVSTDTASPRSGHFMPMSGESELASGVMIARTRPIFTFTPLYTGEVYVFYCSDAEYATQHKAFSTTIQVEVGSSASQYEQYTAERYYPISANPVYGGTLDVTTGVLTVDRGYVVFDGTGWTMYTSGKFYSATDSLPQGNSGASVANMFISNLYPFSGNGDSSSSAITTDKHFYAQRSYHRAWVYDSSFTTLESFQAELSENNLQIVYPLATPQTYQLTPTQVKTLLGYNNIWTDSGTVEVQYLANIGLYIQKIIGATEDDMVANQNISANKYFFVGETLYYSTSAISAGQTIVVGTNCIKTNLADALNALNS